MRLKPLQVLDDGRREVVSAHEFLERLQPFLDGPGDLGVTAAGRANLVVQVGNPALDDTGDRASFGLRACREVLHQLGVEGAGLAIRALESSVGREIGLSDDELSLERDHTGEVQEEALAGAELSN